MECICCIYGVTYYFAGLKKRKCEEKRCGGLRIAAGAGQKLVPMVRIWRQRDGFGANAGQGLLVRVEVLLSQALLQPRPLKVKDFRILECQIFVLQQAILVENITAEVSWRNIILIDDLLEVHQ